MCLHISFFYLVCYFLSHSVVNCQICLYKQDSQPQLLLDITIQSGNRPIKKICLKKETIDTTVTFRVMDVITLKCQRVRPYSNKNAWYIDNIDVRLQWKLEQFYHVLTDIEGVVLDKRAIAGSSSIKMTLDRYDDGLKARCSSSGNESHNNIYVKFKYEEDNNVFDVNEDLNVITITEGQMVPNEFANSVILYYAPDINEDPKVISSNNNIFDSITLKDNGTKYAVWEENQEVKSLTLRSKTITSIVKNKWLVYVEPKYFVPDSESHLPVLLGGGICCVFIFILIFVCCKYCRKKKENRIENPYAEVYEEAHIQPNLYQINNLNASEGSDEGLYTQVPMQKDQVVYAQIDFMKADTSAPMSEREPYAKIVGVIKPRKKTFK